VGEACSRGHCNMTALSNASNIMIATCIGHDDQFMIVWSYNVVTSTV